MFWKQKGNERWDRAYVEVRKAGHQKGRKEGGKDGRHANMQRAMSKRARFSLGKRGVAGYCM
jgi:hypothetical protein